MQATEHRHSTLVKENILKNFAALRPQDSKGMNAVLPRIARITRMNRWIEQEGAEAAENRSDGL